MFSLKAINVLQVGTCIGATSILFAALSPFFQTKKEIVALLEEPAVATQLGHHRAIDSVSKHNSTYTITSNNCTLTADIEYLPSPRGWAGPAAFVFKVGQLNCD